MQIFKNKFSLYSFLTPTVCTIRFYVCMFALKYVFMPFAPPSNLFGSCDTILVTRCSISARCFTSQPYIRTNKNIYFGHCCCCCVVCCSYSYYNVITISDCVYVVVTAYQLLNRLSFSLLLSSNLFKITQFVFILCLISIRPSFYSCVHTPYGFSLRFPYLCTFKHTFASSSS